MRIGIIGTAGRNDADRARLTPDALAAVRGHIESVIEAQEDPITLVSGGSSGIDHLAVKIFLGHQRVAALELCLPCKFENGKFVKPRLNQLHSRDTLDDIAKAIAHQACTVHVSGSFSARNRKIAERAERVFAYTFGGGGAPPVRSGTGMTWRMCDARVREHHNIGDLLRRQYYAAERERRVALKRKRERERDDAAMHSPKRVRRNLFPLDDSSSPDEEDGGGGGGGGEAPERAYDPGERRVRVMALDLAFRTSYTPVFAAKLERLREAMWWLKRAHPELEGYDAFDSDSTTLTRQLFSLARALGHR